MRGLLKTTGSGRRRSERDAREFEETKQNGGRGRGKSFEAKERFRHNGIVSALGVHGRMSDGSWVGWWWWCNEQFGGGDGAMAPSALREATLTKTMSNKQQVQ